MKLIISGGGTGGHIYPGLALIKFLYKQDPNTEILYIGKKNSIEENLCEKEGIPFFGINVRSLYRKQVFKNILTVSDFYQAFRAVKTKIRSFHPDVVIGTGGYVCAPVLYAATKLHVKTIIHEQNSIPGLTNKWLAKRVTKIAISIPASAHYFPKEKVVLTGNPRAQEVAKIPCIPKSTWGLSEEKQLVLLFMGSLGAKFVNDAIIDCLPKLMKLRFIEVLFITGPTHYDSIIKRTNTLQLNHTITIKPYIDNMPELLKVTDLVVCRAGATSLAEITAIGLPTILIPSPYVTNHHQEKNALDLVNREAAIMVNERDLDHLYETIHSLLMNPDKRQKLRIQNKRCGIPDSIDRFIQLIHQIEK